MNITEEEERKIYEELREIPIEDIERYVEVGMKLPIPAEVAMAFKEGYGAEWMRNSGLNLSKAEARYGKDWLDK